MELKQGIYEQIIYNDLKEQLQKLNLDEYNLKKEPLDVEEALNTRNKGK